MAIRLTSFLLSLLFLSATPRLQRQAWSQGIPEPLSLPEALRYASQNSPSLLASRLARENGARDEKSAYYRLFPSLALTSNHGISGPAPKDSFTGESSPVKTSEYQLKLNATLYDNGVTWTGLKVAQVQRQLTEETYRQSNEAQTLEIAKAFYSHSYLLRSLESREAQKKAFDLQYRSSEVQFRRGMRTQQDVLRFKVQFLRAESDVANTRREVEKSARSLFALVGREVPASTTWDWMTSIKPVDLEKIPVVPSDSGLVAQESLSVRLARLQADVAREQLPLSRRTLYPELLLGSSLSYSDSGYWGRAAEARVDRSHWGWQVGLQLNYTLWDWGIRSRTHANEVARLSAAEMGARKSLDTAQAKLANLRSDLERISELCRESEELRRLEQTNYQNIAADYRNGRATYLDLTEALKSLLSARLEFYGAVRDLLQTLAEYRSEEGSLYESLTL